MEVSSAFFSTAVILLGQLLCCVNSQQIHSIRLTGGSNLYNGEVEVLYCETNFTCAWKNVSWNGWTDAKTEVACKQLGLYDGGYTVNYGSGGYLYAMDTAAVDIQCGQITNETLTLNECNVTGCEGYIFSNYVQSTIITCAAPLEAPTLVLSQISATSATINWMIPESRSAINYYVSCTTGYHTHSHSGSSLTLNGLKPYTNYACCVSGVDSNNVVGNENCTYFQTLVGVPLAAPCNLRKMELQNQRITLQWDELSVSERAGPQNTFSLNVSANPSSDSGCLQQHVYHTTDTYISIDNLCPNTLYTISVRACNTPNNVLSCGQYSPTIEIQTVEGSPSIVNNMMCSALSSTQIRVTWSPPTHRNGVIRHYEMVLQDTNTTQTVTQFINGQTTTGTINHLQPNHHYSCSVAAHTTVRGAFRSTATTIKTREDVPSGPPLQLMSFDITRSSFKLNWTKPRFEVQNGNIIGYRIKVRGNSNANRPREIDTINTQAEIVPVEEGTTYIVAVAAMTSVGIGPYSEPTVITVPMHMMPTEKGCNLIPLPSEGLSASTIALSSALAFIFLLFVFFLGLSLYFKVKHSSKRSGKRCAAATSVRDQSQPAIVLESYSALNTFTEEEKKVKPPAVPPKTYLEEDEENEEEESKTSCPSDEDVDRPVYDNCSIGSDSLYDMKLDVIDDMEHSRRSIAKMTGRTIDVIEANAQPPPSLQKHTSKQLPQRKVNVHLVGDYQSPQSHYQKLDTKTMNSFPVYDDINSLRPQRETIKFNNFDTSTKPGSAMPCGQYESLQVKSLNKPSEYQQLTPQKHLS